MSTQIVVIHGGDAFETYEDYLDYLRNKEISKERLQWVDWKKTLQENLGKSYEVLLPQMPNKQNARYLEWRIWFERLISVFDEKVIFIGHSLGGLFLAKFLAEESYTKRITGTFLVAAPFNITTNHPLVDFNLPYDLSRFATQGGKIIVYHSHDDRTVPFSNCIDYQKALPVAHIRTFTDRQHFHQETFPEIVSDIKQLTKTISK